MAEPGSRGEVVIVGGVAALETLMALHDLAPAAVRVTLVAAEPDFVYRPMSVAEPLGLGEARRYPLRRVVDAGRYLAPYVYEREPAAEPGPAPVGFVELEVPLDAAQAAPAVR